MVFFVSVLELRAEILAPAADIKDEALRTSFLTRGPLSARPLREAIQQVARHDREMATAARRA